MVVIGEAIKIKWYKYLGMDHAFLLNRIGTCVTETAGLLLLE